MASSAGSAAGVAMPSQPSSQNNHEGKLPDQISYTELRERYMSRVLARLKEQFPDRDATMYLAAARASWNTSAERAESIQCMTEAERKRRRFV